MLVFRTVKFSILNGCNGLFFFNPKLSKNELGLYPFFAFHFCVSASQSAASIIVTACSCSSCQHKGSRRFTSLSVEKGSAGTP